VRAKEAEHLAAPHPQVEGFHCGDVAVPLREPCRLDHVVVHGSSLSGLSPYRRTPAATARCGGTGTSAYPLRSSSRRRYSSASISPRAYRSARMLWAERVAYIPPTRSI